MTLPGSADQIFCPAIDISQFPNEFDGEEVAQLQNQNLLATVREASEKSGCFRIVNHGIPLDLLQDVESLIAELFALPAEVKERAIVSNPAGRSANREAFYLERLPDLATMQKFHDNLWPEEGNPRFCNIMQAFILSMTDLQKRISKIFLASLNLDVKSFYHSDFEKCNSFMAISRFTPKEKCMGEEEVVQPHTDLGCFTLLYNNNEAGFQIKSKEGKWLDVDPVPHSFVIMVTDLLKVWSNGRYHSAEHRVVYKGWKERICIVNAVVFADDQQVWAPSELVDENIPRRYKPFPYLPYEEAAFHNYKTNEVKIEKFVDVYAGI